MRKLYSTLAVLAAAALALPDAVSAQNNKLIVLLPTTPPNVVHMPVFIAKELGLQPKKTGGARVSPSSSKAPATIPIAPRSRAAPTWALASGGFEIVGRAKGAPTKLILANALNWASMVVSGTSRRWPTSRAKARHPGAGRLCRRAQPRRAARALRSTLRTLISSAWRRKTCPRWSPVRSTARILHVEQEMVAPAVPTLHRHRARCGRFNRTISIP